MAEKWIFVEVSVQDATITNQVLYLTGPSKAKRHPTN